MESYSEAFARLTGVPLARNKADYRSDIAVDECVGEYISRLFVRDRKSFYRLKRILERAADDPACRNPILLSALGHCYYVDCAFDAAMDCFQKAIRMEPEELEQWLSMAFCYRQKGEHRKFDAIILKYGKIIDEFRAGKKDIKRLIVKHAAKSGRR